MNINDSYLPDFIDDPKTVLPSFHGIRKRTRDTLYAFGVDKSPKGSVDAPIRELVDLINKHPSFSTLSSCSGRIAIFDPVRAETTEHETTEYDDQATTQSDRMDSGKGSGGWLFVSHDFVDLEEIDKGLEANKSTLKEGKACSFRFEPMLLHIATSNLERGRQLMKLVLALGFRESGMVVTPSRVTVAVRSYSLALHVPMSTSGPYKLPDEYWRALVADANRRLRENFNRIQKLHAEIEANLFQPRQPVYVSSLPNLNLWGHAAVAVFSENKGKGITDILVFGGYGSGPMILSDEKEKGPSRSDKVYRLRRNGFQWNRQFELLHSMDDTDILDESPVGVMGLHSNQTPWGEREFAAACVLPVESTVVCVFGGRTSPQRPLDDLLLCEYTYSSYAIAQRPLDIRGQLPAARWGHSLTALSGDTEKLAVLVGGRDEASVLSSVHVLSIIRDRASDCAYLLWETLPNSSLHLPRLYHSAISLGDKILVLGGLSHVGDLLETFSSPPEHHRESILFDPVNMGNETSVQVLDGLPADGFGVSAAILDGNSEKYNLILCGGLFHKDSRSKPPVQMFELRTFNKDINIYFHPVKFLSESPLDFGAMVHHQCLAVCSEGQLLEIVTVGGGVQGFGFRQTYANSYMMAFDLFEGSLEVDPLTPIIMKKRLDTKSLPPQPASPVLSVGSDRSEPGLSDVLLVAKKDAKLLKTRLQECSFLNMTYRMSPVADSDFIAVPVTQQCLSEIESGQEYAWTDLVKGRDKLVLPFRSAAFARKNS